MTNKKLAKLLIGALDDGDTNTIWFVIGELEKSESKATNKKLTNKEPK